MRLQAAPYDADVQAAHTTPIVLLYIEHLKKFFRFEIDVSFTLLRRLRFEDSGCT
jgi:hypothetical protein